MDGGQGTGASGEQLLVVDDASGIRDVLAIKLEREGYAVTIAERMGEANQAIADGDFDLILLDVRLPDGSGLDLLQQIRRSHTPLDLPVIIISGLGEVDDVVQALKQGANDYLTKPFDLAIVLARVRTQLTLRRLKRAYDRFLRVASHDLKRPLTLILDVAGQMQTQYPPGTALDADAHASLALLIESGRFMQHIIGDFLELGAMRDGRLQLARLPADLGAIVRQAVARNSSYAQKKQISLHMQFETALPHILADDLRIMQVLENLIGNAIKFCPRGAQVRVSTRREDAWLVCEVTDSGPGIPDEDMPKLFTEYAQLRNRPTAGEQSTGLGLAISRGLVQLHGGDIGARNNPHGGATFWFRLPIS